MSKENKLSRRNFLRIAALTFPAAELAMIAPAGAPSRKETAMEQTETAVRPFHVHFPEDALDDLRRRIKATRWPEKETVMDTSQGVPLDLIQDLARYWAEDRG